MQQEHRECIEQCYECAAAWRYLRLFLSACVKTTSEMMEALHQLDNACCGHLSPGGAIYGIGKRVLTKVCRLCADISAKACAERCARRHDHCQKLRAGMRPMRERLP